MPLPGTKPRPARPGDGSYAPDYSDFHPAANALRRRGNGLGWPGRTESGWDSRRIGSWRADCRGRSEEHTSELQSLMRNSYAVFCLKKKKYIRTKCTKRRQL